MSFRTGSVLFAILIGTGCWAFSASGPGQEARPNLEPRRNERDVRRPSANLRLDLKLILVPVSVTDARDMPFNTLTRNSFRVLEDGVEQPITTFSQEEAPVSLGLIFDSSGSMKNRLEASVRSLDLFFQGSIAGDEFFVVQFSDKAQLLGGFTTSPAEIHSRLGLVEAKGWTALLDAIALGTHQMRNAKNNRRILLVLSDGSDNNSRFSEAEIRSMVVESDLRVYGIGLASRPRILQQLADETGGKVLVAQNLNELPDVVERLSREIRSQYVVGYSSSNHHNDGKYRRVKIELAPPPGTPPLRASWRRGYYAPSD